MKIKSLITVLQFLAVIMTIYSDTVRLYIVTRSTFLTDRLTDTAYGCGLKIILSD